MRQRNLSASASIKIWISESKDLARIMEGSLLPEVARPTSERSKIRVRAMERGLIISIEASDVAALRAASNSYLRWAAAILEVIDTVK